MQLWIDFETFKMQRLQVNIAHEIDSMQLPSWVEWMRDERTSKKGQQRPQVQMRAAFAALILKFQSAISAERTSIFRPERAGYDKIRLAGLLKIHLGVALDPQVGNLPENGNSFFLLALNPPRQEADRRLKSKHSVILLKSMLFWPEPPSDKCYFLSIELSTLCYALMNSIVPYTNQVLPLLEQLTPWTRDRVKLLQSPYFFPPPYSHALNSISRTHGHFVLSSLWPASRDQNGGPSDSTIDIYDLTEKYCRGLWTV